MPEIPPTAAIDDVPAVVARRVWARRALSNWRLLLVRMLAAGLAVMLTFAIVPGLRFSSWQPGEFLVVTVTYGLLVAVVKPLLEFLTLRWLVATLGLIVIMVNAAVLYLLAQMLPQYVHYDRLGNLLVGGLLVGILGLVLETLLGASPPMLDTRARELPHG